jgi:hypothetical protein
MFLGINMFLLLVITMPEDGNISIIQKKGEERGEGN